VAVKPPGRWLPAPMWCWFTVMAGVGFAGGDHDRCVARVEGPAGLAGVFVSGMRALRGPRASITLAVDGRIEPPRRVRTVVVGNCGKLLAGLVLMPARRMFWMNRVPGADYSCAAELFETAHRSQSGPRPP
jgi:hypothetical protein